MNRTGIEKALQSAVNSAPEIPFEQIAAQPFIRMQEHDYITRQEPVKKAAPVRKLTLAAAMCLVVLLSVTGWYTQNKVTDSIITLDVNPSIEILTNKKDEILAVKAMNEDARKIIGDTDYSGAGLTDTVTLLINSLVENSYINQEKNAVLLTVTNKNDRKADDLLKKMGTAIKDSLNSKNIEPLILSQILPKKVGSKKLEEKYHISRGKLQLIQDMIAANPDFTIDKLVKLPVEQLLKMAYENHMDLSKYLTLNAGAANPAVTEIPDKPENDSSKTPSQTPKDSKEDDSKLEDRNDSDNEDSYEENDKEDRKDENQVNEEKDQKIEGRNQESEDKSENEEKYSSDSGISKNKGKEDTEVKGSEQSPDYTENKEDTESQEDSTISQNESDEDSTSIEAWGDNEDSNNLETPEDAGTQEQDNEHRDSSGDD